ncbi:MAG: head GIN domain-containing protein [Bacteroidales bacterium]
MRQKGICKVSLFMLVSAVLMNSCDPFFNCVDGNGILKQEERFVTSFSGVENTTEANVDVIADSVYSIKVTADENLLGIIETSVRSDNNLVISMDNGRCVRTDNYMLVEIHMPYLDYVELTGSGNVDVYDFECQDIEIINSGSGGIDVINLYSTGAVDLSVYGSGSISIWGKAHTGDYLLTGSGDILADGLMVDDCYVSNSGSGNVYCHAYDYLEAVLNGSGDIIYSGNPVTEFTDNGSGVIRSRTN